MRVLSVHNRYQQRGGEDGSTEQERALLRSHGHEVIAYEEHNDRVDKMSKLHAAVRTVWSVETYRNIRRLIRKERPDIVHVQNFFPLISPSVFWACEKERVPVVLHVRNFRLLCPSAFLYFKGRIYEDNVGKLFPWRAVRDAVYRDSHLATFTTALMLFIHRLIGTWSKKVSAYIALTEFQKRKMIEGGLPADKIYVKSNFIQTTECFKEKKNKVSSAIIEKLAVDTIPYCLFVGRLSPEKGCDVLLKAWARLQRVWSSGESECQGHMERSTEFGDIRPNLLIVGDGPDERQLMSLVRSQDSVKFLGRKESDDVLALAQGALSLVFPSAWYEGMPRTIIESFSVSTPVVASNIGSMSEMITHQKTGLLFKSGNSEELAQLLEWAFKHPEQMDAMGQNARLEFVEKYMPEKNYQQLIEIYQACSITPL